MDFVEVEICADFVGAEFPTHYVLAEAKTQLP